MFVSIDINSTYICKLQCLSEESLIKKIKRTRNDASSFMDRTAMQI